MTSPFLRRLTPLGCLVLLTCLMPACTRNNSAAATNGSGKKKVLTSFTILADIASNVAGQAAEVVSLTKPGAEIHGYEPTPKDIVKAQQADLVLWNGLNLERWFEKFFFGSQKHTECNSK